MFLKYFGQKLSKYFFSLEKNFVGRSIEHLPSSSFFFFLLKLSVLITMYRCFKGDFRLSLTFHPHIKMWPFAAALEAEEERKKVGRLFFKKASSSLGEKALSLHSKLAFKGHVIHLAAWIYKAVYSTEFKNNHLSLHFFSIMKFESLRAGWTSSLKL